MNGKKLEAQCTEAALVGFISEEILKDGQILLSDRAGQFAVFDHAACWVHMDWVHMERPLRKIHPCCEFSCQGAYITSIIFAGRRQLFLPLSLIT